MVIKDLIETINTGKSKVCIVNTTGTLGVVANTKTTQTLPTEISVAGSSVIPIEISVVGASSGTIGTTERVISFPYSGTGTTKDYTFTTTENIICDILIVGGGGAGGNSMGGGGGAGGVVYAISQTLSTGTYTVKVGRGGIGLTLTDATGQGTIGIDQDGVESSLMNSNASSYISLTLGGVSQQLRGYGGGGGGIYYNPSFVNGRNGGSGGGCTESNNNGFVVNTAGSATQPATYWNGTAYVVGGKAGRQNTTTVQDYQGGGGGGLGGVSTDYRNGNDGVAISITGTSQFYAAGGGAGQYIGTSTAAGLGGSSIGGNGRIWTGSAYAAAPRDVATSGVNGTGSGGGGAAYGQTPVSIAGSGGSGIVIIRYRKPSSEIVVSSIIAGTTDRYVSFPYSGTGTTKDYTITTTEALICDILVVGGGGAGGNSIGGGGGAGGVVYTISQTLTTGTYTVKIGRGGIGTIHPGGDGQGTVGIDQDGQDSFIQLNSVDVIFSMGGVNQSLRGKGGGGGGVYYAAATAPGRAGGSGGGSGERENAVYNGGISTQGNTYWNGSSYVAGGSSGYGNLTTDGNYFAPGGGGAGNTQFDNIYNGKTGVEISITGTPQFYAAGGGGGQLYATGGTAIVFTTRGLGGSSIGGNGRIKDSASYTRDATSGANGTGSGGGGGAYNATPFLPAGSGGSGIIIIRYRKPTNTITNSIYSILNDGVISTNSNVYSNLFTNKDIFSLWTSSTGTTGYGSNIYYNTSNVGIGTLDPVVPLHIYNNITPLPTAISVVGATSGTIGTTDRIISFSYTSDSVGLTGQTQYTFTTTENLICDILVVGGGGAGGQSLGGGGGGGAVLYGTNISIASGSYVIKVGRGGINGETRGKSTEGFGATILGGGCADNTGWDPPNNTLGDGNIGGSGAGGRAVQSGFRIMLGGSVGVSTKGTILTTATLYNGNVGSNGISQNLSNSSVGAGGGGGATEAGGLVNAGSNGKGGKGGDGVSINITGTTYWWGAGGGGSAYSYSGGNGGKGGGGAAVGIGGVVGDSGYTAASGKNAGNGTGSGGGGAQFQDYTGGNGGSGIVIIRYRLPTVFSNARLLLDTTTTGTPSIEFRRGVDADMQNDFRIINDTSPANGTIKILCENNMQSFNDTTANLAWFSSNETIIHKNTSMNGRVGIGTTYHTTMRLDVLGYANVSGAVSVGGLSVSGSSSSGVSAIITNSLTSNTSLTIRNGMIPPSITSPLIEMKTETTGAFPYQVFTYTTETAGAGTGQSLYTLTIGTGGVVCDILIVGGGGAGGMQIGGGGGGGAVLYGTNISIIQGIYTIKVGRGATPGETLGKSTEGFGATILGGGCAGNANWGANPTTANSGGSGAGGKAYWGSGSSPSTLAAGGVGVSTKGTILTTATLYNGNVGGTAVQQVGGNPIQSAGGGGAGAVGGNGNGSASQTGNGGDGVLVNITGENYYWGGGGGGGNYQSTATKGGRGGGGAGERNDGGGSLGFGTGGADAYNAPVNMNGGVGSGGGGGGGGYGTATAGNGGSGIVIIRYLTSTSSSIELIRGTAGDANRDYKLGNYNAEFKVISSTSGVDTDYIKITTAGAITNPTGTANWSIGSDRRIKENIERASYNKCYDNINKLELKRFNYIDDFNTVSRDRAQLGFIAQEVKDIFPKSISTQGYYSDTLNIPDLLSIDISQINYALYGAVKKLIELNKEDKEKLASLDNRIKTITNFLNISLDTSNIAIDTSNLLDTSNISINTINLLDTSSNITIE